MANFSVESAQAVARLRRYTPPPTVYHDLPLTRKAAVLILLFPDKLGELRVVLTMRASTLKTYAGQAALPGGKSDDPSESPFQTARREAYEEIGLPLDDSKLPPPFQVEHICELPTNLARTELGVRPCVALLSAAPSSKHALIPSVEDALIPRLDAREVAAVFTAPFRDFLRASVEDDRGLAFSSSMKRQRTRLTQAQVEKEDWYSGMWIDWYDKPWRMHSFYIPVQSGPVAWPSDDGDNEQKDKVKDWQEHNSDAASLRNASLSVRERMTQVITGSISSAAYAGYKRRKSQENSSPTKQVEDDTSKPSHFRVFGMTARILVDAARVAYDQEPEFEHNSHFGDEEMIVRLMRMGRMTPIRKPGDELTTDIMRAAAKM